MNHKRKKEIIETLDEKYINVDPLKPTYQNIIDKNKRLQSLERKTTALLVIDVQYLDAAPGYGVFKDALNCGVSLEAQEYYFTMLKKIVLPNIRLLQDKFRELGLEVIHTRICSLTQDGRDRSPGHKRLNLHAAPGSKEAEFLEEVAPKGDEIIINKTASGVFTSTNLHYVLRNLGIEALYVTGVYTNECVSTTVRDGSDLGYFMTLIEDGCTTVTEELHIATIKILKDRYARVIDTQTALKEIENLHLKDNLSTERSV